ncbi:MAG TPA: hypothetical protein VGH28_15605 [Polyangiaceae bacterium]|jgi:hypothetical protein
MRLLHRFLPFVVALGCAACDVPYQLGGANDPSSDDSATATSTSTSYGGVQTVVLSDGTVTQAIPLGASDSTGPQLVQPINGDSPQIGTPL